MPHVSRKELSTEMQKQINTQLVRILLRNGPKTLGELLSETEQIMLGKRLAAILMLEEEFSYYRIAITLGISTSTIKRLHKNLLAGDFPTLAKVVHTKKERQELWNTLAILFRGGLPPQGRGRWQDIDALLAKMK